MAASRARDPKPLPPALLKVWTYEELEPEIRAMTSEQPAWAAAAWGVALGRCCMGPDWCGVCVVVVVVGGGGAVGGGGGALACAALHLTPRRLPCLPAAREQWDDLVAQIRGTLPLCGQGAARGLAAAFQRCACLPPPREALRPVPHPVLPRSRDGQRLGCHRQRAQPGP
jgi:hypothetical protein